MGIHHRAALFNDLRNAPGCRTCRRDPVFPAHVTSAAYSVGQETAHKKPAGDLLHPTRRDSLADSLMTGEKCEAHRAAGCRALALCSRRKATGNTRTDIDEWDRRFFRGLGLAPIAGGLYAYCSAVGRKIVTGRA